MSDILKQIQALQEQFSNLFEDSVKKAERRNLDKSIKADHKEAKELKKKISDCWTRHSCYLFPSVKSETINDERIGYVRKLKKLIADGNQKLQKRDELNKEEAVKAGKENKATNKSETHKFSLTNEEFVQQIMDLKEAFSNLFEVEGLGNPAVDVPPSQNKIKKDVKTKDGKAELVSVEDELFPYDGNKKEQYRQKIIDTINGMIQGTSTLEDLLQIVRQKKAPLKEAMELVEDLKAIITKKHGPMFGDKATLKGQRLHSKAIEANTKELIDAARRNLPDEEKDSTMALDREANKIEAKRANTKNKIGEFKTKLLKRAYGNEKKPETLKETLSVMEDLIDMIDKAEKVGLNMKGKKAKVQDAREKDINQAAEREGTSPLKIKGRRLSNDDIVKAQQKDQKADKGSKIVRGELEVVGHDFEDRPVYMYKAPLKEAMELMEEVINELHPDTVRSALHAHNKKTIELEDKVNKRIGEIFKKHGIKGNNFCHTL